MKKLLVVLMVLSMATMANAALTINVNGQNPSDSAISLMPSESVSISIVGDGATPSNTDYYLINTPVGQGTMSGGVMLYTGNLSSIAPATPGQLATLVGLGYATVNVDYLVFGQLPPPPPPMVGVLVDEIIFHCDSAPGDALLSLINLVMVYDEENDIYTPVITVMDSQVIHQIPEPFTMALLGLGGLFLRRRK